MKKGTSGFTIVELLIVIVVIAILTAISIVAYSGVQQKAKNSQVASGAKQYVTAIESHRAVHGIYPSYTGCLGANYPSNRCWLFNGNPSISVSASLDAQLSEFIPNKPTLITELLHLNYTGDSYDRGGLTYRYTSQTEIELRYYLAGLNQPCLAGFTAGNEAGLSSCVMNLPQ